MIYSKKMLFITIISIFAVMLAACNGEATGAENKDEGDVTNLRLGTLSADNGRSVLFLSASDFAQEVTEKTDGKVTFDLYPASQLGGEVEMAEQVSMGVLDMAIITSTTVANFVEEMNVIEMPFLLRDREHAFKVLDGEIGKKLSEKMEDANFINLGYWDVGFKNISNSERPIYTVEDLSGLDIRTGQSNILINTYNALGANPTPISFPETYSSIQQGVVDGFEGAYQPFTDIKLYEIQDYYSELEVGYHTSLLIINKDVLASMDEEVQELLIITGEEHTKKQRERSIAVEEELKETMREAGVEIIEADEIDKEAFRHSVQGVYDKYDDVFGDIVSEIENVR